MEDDPFGALGLPARADLPDEEVRAAWKRIAAATHPDRDDGGDPARFGAAAAAYDTLRTSFGRGEALADLTAGVSRRSRHRARHGGGASRRRLERARRHFGNAGLGRLGPRLAGLLAARRRAWGLAARVLAAVAVSAGALIVAGWTPGTAGVLAGALTWLLVIPALHSR